MVSATYDPWGESYLSSKDAEPNKSQQFEDDFKEKLDLNTMQVNDFVALDDSEVYIERLEKKLNKITVTSDRNTNGRSLLASLSARRQTHNMNLLNDTDSFSHWSNELDEGSELNRSRGIISDGNDTPLNNLLLRVAPDMVALSAEELVTLPSADSLGGEEREEHLHGATVEQKPTTPTN